MLIWKRAEYSAASLRAISTITEASTNAAISQTVNAALTKNLQYATFTSCCHDVSLSAVLLACVMSSFSCRLSPKAHRGGATFNLSNAQYITSVLSVNLPIFLSSAYACLAATHVLQRFHVIFDMIFSAFQHISNENTHFSSTNVDGAVSINGGQRDRTAVRQAPHACRLCTSLCAQTPSNPATNSQRWE